MTVSEGVEASMIPILILHCVAFKRERNFDFVVRQEYMICCEKKACQ